MNPVDLRWLLVIDIRCARLLRCVLDRSAGRCQVQPHASFANNLKPHDRGGKPAVSAARGSDFTNPDRDHDLMRDQFAAETVKWIAAAARSQGIKVLEVFAGAEFLGALRKAGLADVGIEINERHADLSPLTDGEIEAHPLVFRMALL